MSVFTRRTFWRYGVACGLLVAGSSLASGCSLTDPVIRPTGSPPQPWTPSPTPTPTPPAGTMEARRAETQATAGCRALAAGADLAEAQRENLELAAAIHTRHLAALESPFPAERPTAGSPPSPAASSGSARPETIEQLSDTLAMVRGTHHDLAVAADGPLALLWASLAAGAAQSRSITVRSTAVRQPRAEAEHQPYVVVPPAAAAQDLVAQLHAIVFGYQVALAPMSGDDAEPMVQRLAELRLIRDQLSGWLRTQGESVPASNPEYDTSDPDGGRTDSDDEASALIARMEQALLPFLGAWVAACEKAQRPDAVDWLTDAAQRAVAAGARPLWWPGFPD